MAVDNLATTLQALRKLDEAEELFDRSEFVVSFHSLIFFLPLTQIKLQLH
jgi:hypothetical protein